MGRWETMENALKAVDDVAEAWRRDRRELLNEIAWLHSELHGAELEAEKATELKAENVRLRSCLEDAAENERLTTHEFNQLKEERDKLRELVSDMWFWGYFGHIDRESEEEQIAHIDGVIARMRELGVEV